MESINTVIVLQYIVPGSSLNATVYILTGVLSVLILQYLSTIVLRVPRISGEPPVGLVPVQVHSTSADAQIATH